MSTNFSFNFKTKNFQHRIRYYSVYHILCCSLIYPKLFTRHHSYVNNFVTVQDDDLNVPGERTVYRIMNDIGLTHKPQRKPNGIKRADKLTRKSDDLFKHDFTTEEPNQKAVTALTMCSFSFSIPRAVLSG